MDKKNFAIIYIIAFGILAYFLWSNNDSIAATISSGSAQGVFYYFLSNPIYILLVASVLYFNQEAGYIRNIIGSFLIILSSDIISFARLPSGGFNGDIFLEASPDSLVMHELVAKGMGYSTAYTFYYLVLPILLTLIALQVLGLHNFVKTLKGQG
ncbi:MAG: hypothetical protein AABY22_34570 [Nanoarchaeota archaeon]